MARNSRERWPLLDRGQSDPDEDKNSTQDQEPPPRAFRIITARTASELDKKISGLIDAETPSWYHQFSEVGLGGGVWFVSVRTSQQPDWMGVPINQPPIDPPAPTDREFTAERAPEEFSHLSYDWIIYDPYHIPVCLIISEAVERVLEYLNQTKDPDPAETKSDTALPDMTAIRDSTTGTDEVEAPTWPPRGSVWGSCQNPVHQNFSPNMPEPRLHLEDPDCQQFVWADLIPSEKFRVPAQTPEKDSGKGIDDHATITDPSNTQDSGDTAPSGTPQPDRS